METWEGILPTDLGTEFENEYFNIMKFHEDDKVSVDILVNKSHVCVLVEFGNFPC